MEINTGQRMSLLVVANATASSSGGGGLFWMRATLRSDCFPCYPDCLEISSTALGVVHYSAVWNGTLPNRHRHRAAAHGCV